MESSEAKMKLPGYGKPLTARKDQTDKFPIAILGEDHVAPLLPIREYTIMEMMNRITDKLDWHWKVCDDTIVSKWREEFLSPGESNDETKSTEGVEPTRSPKGTDTTEDTGAQPDDKTDPEDSTNSEDDEASNVASSGRTVADISPKMVEWAIAETRYKAEIFQHSKCIEALDEVYKSDTIVSEKVRKKLQAAVKPLEDVPEKEKDWHPGSNNQVLDLVHPSVYPLIYGQSKILPNHTCTLDDCLRWIGKGETLAAILESDDVSKEWSRKFQWLPTEFEISPDTKEVKVASYINNLHPVYHKDLYDIIPKIVAQAIPLWDRVLDRAVWTYQVPERVTDWSNSDMGYEKGWEDREPKQGEDEDDDDWSDRVEAWKETRVIVPPEPGEFKPPVERLTEHYKHEVENQDLNPAVNLRKRIWGLRKDKTGKSIPGPVNEGAKNLQIIVKLANIHLTPEKPDYEGGTWHVEGQANESICATALYYYSSSNITESLLCFRQSVDNGMELPYDQDDHRALEEIYNIQNHGPTIQDLGAVVTSEGRLLAFPNTMQHRVAPFSLADKTKPGHRKILALFLVDPHTPVISTANVPPQQKSWWEDSVVDESRVLERLPVEIQEDIKGLEYEFPVSLEVARSQREELMAERSVFVEEHNQDYESRNTFSLCEH